MMTLDKDIQKIDRSIPLWWLDYKPEIEDDYFITSAPTRQEPVTKYRLGKLMKWMLGSVLLGAINLPIAEAFTEFSSNAQALTWIFMFGFWFLLIYMTFHMRGIHGEHIGMLAILQMLFGVVIGLNFWGHSVLIGAGVLMGSMSVFIVFMFGIK